MTAENLFKLLWNGAPVEQHTVGNALYLSTPGCGCKASLEMSGAEPQLLYQVCGAHCEAFLRTLLVGVLCEREKTCD